MDERLSTTGEWCADAAGSPKPAVSGLDVSVSHAHNSLGSKISRAAPQTVTGTAGWLSVQSLMLMPLPVRSIRTYTACGVPAEKPALIGCCWMCCARARPTRATTPRLGCLAKKRMLFCEGNLPELNASSHAHITVWSYTHLFFIINQLLRSVSSHLPTMSRCSSRSASMVTA